MLELLLKRPVSVWIAALGLVVLGAFSLWRLPLSLLPTLERPRLKVTMADDDRSRSELLHELVIPLERRLQTLDGVLDVYSTVADGEAVVMLDTEWQTDVDRLRIEAERRLVQVSAASLDELVVEIEAGDLQPILQFAVFGGEAHQRSAFVEKVLVPELGRLPGAGELKVYGTAHLRPVVEPHGADLAARGLNAASVVRALEPMGQSHPLGRIRDGALLRPLVVRRDVVRLEELKALRIPDAGDLQLGDVADITLQSVPDQGLFRHLGRPGALVDVYRAPGANAVRLAREGKKVVRRLARRSGHLELQLMADRSREVVQSLMQLAQAGLLGLLLGTGILRFMLGRWRPTLTLAVVVPVSIVAAFSAFFLFDISLDIVSLAGLALAAGMLVDNSIVVLESISSSADRGSAKPVVEGTRQIAMPLVAGFLTTAVVFLPLIYLKGLARAFFGVQAFAIVSTLVISLGLSLTLTPIMARRTGRESRKTLGRSPGQGVYERVLKSVIARPGLFAGAAVVVLLAVVVMVAPRLTSELIPSGTTRVIGVDIHLPKALGLDDVERRLQELEQRLAEVPGVSGAYAVYRGGADGRRALVSRRADAEIELTLEASQAMSPALAAVRQAVSRSPGLAAEVNTRGGAVSSIVEQSSRGLELQLAAGTPERLERLAQRVKQALGDQGLSATVRRGQGPNQGLAVEAPAWSLTWDPVQLAGLRADETELGRQVAASLGGFTSGRAAIPGVEAEIWIEPTSPGDLRQLPLEVEGAQARWLPLGAMARIDRRWTEPALQRRNGRPALYLSVDQGLEAADTVEQVLAEIPLAVDEQASLSGQVQEIRRSFDQLRLAMILALLLVFLTVAALYESLTMPLVVMITVPVAAAGGLVALALTGQTMNVMSFLGLILLAGIVVNNAIVLVHRAEQLRDHMPSSRQAISTAAAERYRPILMTTLTTLLGMIPLALLGGEGVELRRALATTVSGGLVTSWAAALLVVPALYLSLARRGRG